jgi:flagellar hook-associated protein 3 FlgL
MEMLSQRYESSELNYKEMRSDAVDADMAEAITNLTTAQTVYKAALAGGAEILQTSLIDFLS